MTHIVAKLAVLSTLAVSVSGCAQMYKFGDNMWGHTKSAANFVSSPVTKLLRGAPQQHYVFDAPQVQEAQYSHYRAPHRTPYYQSSNHAAQYQRPQYQAPYSAQPIQRVEQAAPAPAFAPVSAPTPSPAPVYEQYAHAPAPAPQPSYEPAPTDDISFVKVGGGSDMRDWTACEASSDGFIRVTETGYIIAPEFENCMRSKGYKPESEVQADA